MRVYLEGHRESPQPRRANPRVQTSPQTSSAPPIDQSSQPVPCAKSHLSHPKPIRFPVTCSTSSLFHSVASPTKTSPNNAQTHIRLQKTTKMETLAQAENIAAQRLRKTFKYPSDSDDEDAVEAGMDAQGLTPRTIHPQPTPTRSRYSLYRSSQSCSTSHGYSRPPPFYKV
jgi:hypothetical protein